MAKKSAIKRGSTARKTSQPSERAGEPTAPQGPGERIALKAIITESMQATRVQLAYTDPRTVHTAVHIANEVQLQVDEPRNFFVRLSFRVTVTKKNAEEGTPPDVEITLVMIVCCEYSVGVEPNHNERIAFANSSALFMAWPYFREFVQSVSFRLMVPPILIPLFIVPTALLTSQIPSSSAPQPPSSQSPRAAQPSD